MITLPAELARAIEDYRFESRLRTEAEAIRQLIEAGLKAKPVRQPSGQPSPASASEPGGDHAPEPVAPKPSPPRKSAPRAKAAAMSKEAQIRALRERDGR